jgi:hypothetical protein
VRQLSHVSKFDASERDSYGLKVGNNSDVAAPWSLYSMALGRFGQGGKPDMTLPMLKTAHFHRSTGECTLLLVLSGVTVCGRVGNQIIRLERRLLKRAVELAGRCIGTSQASSAVAAGLLAAPFLVYLA